MPDHQTIAPHGGTLVDLLVPGEQRDRALTEADHLPKLVVSERELSDLEMLAVGALSPLTGFVGEADYLSVLATMHLSNGLAWSIPVTLSLTDEDVKRIGAGTSVALLPAEGAPPLAIVDLTEVFKRDREKEALAVFGTEDLEHPGVRALEVGGPSSASRPATRSTGPTSTSRNAPSRWSTDCSCIPWSGRPRATTSRRT
jgi:sulfate adenylyltransferase